MDCKKLQSIATKVTKKLSDSKVTILDWTQYSARVQIVSTHFEGKSISARIEELYELFYSVVPRTYLLQFEAWTPSEFGQLKQTKIGGDDGGESGGGIDDDEDKAASPPTQGQTLLT